MPQKTLSLLVIALMLAGCLRPTTPQATLPQNTPAAGGEQPASGSYIDTHMHLDGLYRSDNQQVKDYQTAADNLIALMDQYGVEKALLLEVPGIDYVDLLDAIAKYPDRLYLMAGGGQLNPIIQGTDPAAVTPELEAEFEQITEQVLQAGSLGFGEMLSMHLCMSEQHSYQVASPDHPLFLLLADIAARHDVPIDLHMEAVPEQTPVSDYLLDACSANPPAIEPNIAAFERLLAHNRNTRIVWQHIGWDNVGYMTPDLVGKLLQTHPNLYIALRVEETFPNSPRPVFNRIVDEEGNIQPEWLAVINDFPDRVMIGGDEFVGIPGITPRKPQSFEETWPILSQLSPEIAALVGRENALRVYGLGTE